MENIDKNIADFRQDTLEVEQFLTGTRVSYSFFKGQYPELLRDFDKKERDDEEVEGMEIFKKLNKSVTKYETEIYKYCFINLIARTEAFLNDILEALYIWENSSLTEKEREKSILNFSHTSFKKKMEFLKRKFNLTFPLIEEHNSDIIELFSTRNIILHNNGLINETYLKINKTSKFTIGDKKVVDENYLKLTFVLLILIAKSIEEKVKEKMNASS
ncbi:hypothetical protein [uncultured Tenacibaculum sp.]|uniref:hypothetical protein n=1 Tax=uncultured Tenacibaculum sp. TaxID=174713 RepID=UPI0026033041|nr:hypothetical protein [uncultured Tenacibaculum sp.]